MTSVLGSWRRIEDWLALHAPQVLARLRGPASEEQIAALESCIGARLPDDARQSFAIHDGGEDFGLIDGNELLSLERAADEWEFWADFSNSPEVVAAPTRPGPGVGAGWWRAGWLPLTYNGAGDYACLDLDPAEGGRVGQIIQFWHDDDRRGVLAPSLGAWLDAFASDLEAGAYRYDARYEVLERAE